MPRRVPAFLLVATTMTAATACQSTAPPPAAPAAVERGIDVDGMDRSVAAGDDFNAYANGGWLKATEIPADKASYGNGAMLVDETRKRTEALIQELAGPRAPTGGDGQKIGDFYAAFMDEAAIEAKGLAPLKAQLDAIAAIGDQVGAGPRPWQHAPRRCRPAERHELLHGAPASASWSSQALDDPLAQRAVSAPGRTRACPTATTTLDASPSMAELRTKPTRRTSQAMLDAGRRCRRRPRGRRASSRSRTEIARAHATRVDVARRARATTLDTRGAGDQGPGPRLGSPASRRPASAMRPRSSSGTRRPCPASRRSSRASRSTRGRTGSRSMLLDQSRASCRRRSSSSGSRSMARR